MMHRVLHGQLAVVLAAAVVLSSATPAGGQASSAQQATWPAGPPGIDLAAVEGDLVADYPWLGALGNRAAVTGLFARRIAWYRTSRNAIAARDALPDPRRTIVSSERFKRRRKRAPYERQRVRAVEALDKLPRSQPIAIDDLLAPDFVSAGASAAERAGLAAMRASIRKRRGFVVLDQRGWRPRVFVYLDGSWVRLRGNRIHPDAFFERVTPAFLELQAVYHDAFARAGRTQLGQMVAADPGLARAHFRSLVASQRHADTEARLDALASTRQARVTREVQGHRQQVAGRLRAEVAGAVAPAIVVARLFAVQGVSDIFLAVFPFGKATDVLRTALRARKARKAGQLAEEVASHLAAVLTREQANFTRAVARLEARDMRALGRIHKRVRDPETLTRLAVRAGQGRADLVWNDRLLARRAIDADGVDNFMRFDAYPSWSQLRAVVDNTVHGAARASVMSKLVGFVGEQSAARHVKSAAFARQIRANGPLTVVRGERSLDVIALTEDNKLHVFAEVKNWSAATWSSKSQLGKLFRQLEKHDEKIEEAVKGLGDAQADLRVQRLVMVTPRGFNRLEKQARVDIRTAIDKAGWRLEIIPRAHIEDVGAFITRLRKGT